MRITLDNLLDGRQSWRFSLADAWASDAAAQALDAAPTALSGELHVQVDDRQVVVRGAFEVSASGTCERCGETVVRNLQAPFELRYVVEPQIDQEELELSADELDVGYHDGTLDLGNVLSEALSLEVPARVVCDDTPACDGRTSALLLEFGRAGDPHASPFSSLKGLALS